ncbi:4-amino-4-deoxy-L-arabinose transferase [Aeromicrobium camelliae]|uniref:4-amino-4-deoxy-L-arabinose transferase n=1 Tax=Aeromicrobium camelliae TaxID=1538144 RepID=A0A3N6WLA8_9ACTN|nr:4-amino-4-deoxy-L-arabinose transferase [Aeromicrobium camelliae]RQN08356.1 4-amino-4-deoxy-L-arabinose transferase [Aeromicrobium camelliae]
MSSAFDVVADALAEREPACGRVRVVAVDGRSGAGKSSFAEQLAERVSAAVFSLEDVYPGWHGLEATVPIVRDVLAALAVDEFGRARRWDWERDRPGDEILVPPVPTLIVEGVGAGAMALRPFLSLLVWLEAPEPVRKERALARDGETFAPWWDVWAAQERAHFAREMTAGAADLVIRTG